MLHYCPFCNVVLKTIGKPLEAQYRWVQYVECVVCDMSGCFCKECKKSTIFTKQKQRRNHNAYHVRRTKLIKKSNVVNDSFLNHRDSNDSFQFGNLDSSFSFINNELTPLC